MVKQILLIVEVAAVVGLLLSAGWLWQKRQQLQRELELGQQIEAVLLASEQAIGPEQNSEQSPVSCRTVNARRAMESLQPCDTVRLPGEVARTALPTPGLGIRLLPFPTSPKLFVRPINESD